MCPLYVSLICVPYMCPLYVRLTCVPYMRALYVCLICVPYRCNVGTLITFPPMTSSVFVMSRPVLSLRKVIFFCYLSFFVIFFCFCHAFFKFYMYPCLFLLLSCFFQVLYVSMLLCVYVSLALCVSISVYLYICVSVYPFY